MKDIEVDYISPQTACNKSLLISMGYKLIKKRKAKDKLDEMFEVRYKGKHIPHWNNAKGEYVPYVKRRFFFDFAKHMHEKLNMSPMEMIGFERRIEGYID